MSQSPFSRRHGYTGQPQEITIREDAPESLRFFVLNKAEELGLKPNAFRDITCSVLEERPDPSNWSPYPNIWNEVEGHVYGCPWFQVYDCTSPKKTDTEIWLTVTVCGLIRTLHFVQGRNPA